MLVYQRESRAYGWYCIESKLPLHFPWSQCVVLSTVLSFLFHGLLGFIFSILYQKLLYSLRSICLIWNELIIYGWALFLTLYSWIFISHYFLACLPCMSVYQPTDSELKWKMSFDADSASMFSSIATFLDLRSFFVSNGNSSWIGYIINKCTKSFHRFELLVHGFYGWDWHQLSLFYFWANGHRVWPQ